MKMRFGQFLRLDFAGALLYTTTYLLVGYLCRDFLAATLKGSTLPDKAMEIVVIGALVVYAIYRILQFRKFRKYRIVPRVQVQELAKRLSEGEGDRVQIVDVRSHGYQTSELSVSLDQSGLNPTILEEIKDLPKDKDVYVYCT